MTSYLEKCRQAIASIDITELGAMPLGEIVDAGSSFAFRCVGGLTVSGVTQSVGLKLPHGGSNSVAARFYGEAAFVDCLVAGSPELASLVPSFMGTVAIERSSVGAIITEDASLGKTIPVQSTMVSEATRGSIYHAFSELGTPQEVLEYDELCNTVAFTAGDRERLLDFTPRPIRALKLRESAKFISSYIAANDMVQQLQLTLPANSTLARSILCRF